MADEQERELKVLAREVLKNAGGREKKSNPAEVRDSEVTGKCGRTGSLRKFKN